MNSSVVVVTAQLACMKPHTYFTRWSEEGEAKTWGEKAQQIKSKPRDR
jgi:hypothetical protein